MSYFETKVKMEEIQRTGASKVVTNTYLFDALSFTEAESRATEEFREQSVGEFSVASVRKRNFNEVVESVNTIDDKFYEVRLAFITINDAGAGSGTTLLAASELKRKAYGFEIKKDFCNDARKYILSRIQPHLF